MTDVHCFTSVSFLSLDRARVLAETVKRHHPDWRLWLCLADREPPGFRFDLTREPFENALYLEDLGITNLPAWIFGREREELCAAVRGTMLSHLFGAGAGKVVYFDSGIALFDTLAPVIERLDHHPIVLTPRVAICDHHLMRFRNNEIDAPPDRIYDSGFIAVAGTKEGRAFATWWNEKLRTFGDGATPTEDVTDRRWCDLIPALFPDTCILHDPGCNVGSWNIGSWPIHIIPSGEIMAGNVPLRFINFTGIDTAPQFNSDEHLALFELLRWYRARLRKYAVAGLPENYWAFARYEDGSPILPTHRIAFRGRSDLKIRYPNPFASGPGSYQEWCLAHLQEL
jgi:hypothetical protein